MTLVNTMMDSGDITKIASNPLAQFGRGAKSYLGASLLPERLVTENAYREEFIRYRSVIANNGTRYSPVQIKGNQLAGWMDVRLGESDEGSEFSGRDYDALLRILAKINGTKITMEAAAAVTKWMDTYVNIPLIELNEKQRWDAIVDAQVVLKGSNNYEETVTYPNPTGHRAAQSAAWSTDSTDIMEDIFAMVDLMSAKGYKVSRMITSRPVLSIMAGNNTIKSRANLVVVNSSGQITSTPGRADHAAINAIAARDGLPPIELYDAIYNTTTGNEFFLKRDVFVMIATTGQSEEIDLGDEMRVINDTLGYQAIGVPVGQPNPGRHMMMQTFGNKPPRIQGEGWQTSLPVITEPEAICVITGIS